MLINSSLAAANAQPDRVAVTRPTVSPEGAASAGSSAAADVSAGSDPQLSGGVAVPVVQSRVGLSSGQLDAGADNLNAALPEITSPAEAQESVNAAINNLLNHSTLALLAQGGHTPQTVLALLSQ